MPTPPSIKKILDDVLGPNGDGGAEPDRLERLAASIAALEKKVDQLIEAGKPKPEVERRSQMTAARKSQLIERLGPEGYRRLPW
jgi:hypothetical protein